MSNNASKKAKAAAAKAAADAATAPQGAQTSVDTADNGTTQVTAETADDAAPDDAAGAADAPPGDGAPLVGAPISSDILGALSTGGVEPLDKSSPESADAAGILPVGTQEGTDPTRLKSGPAKQPGSPAVEKPKIATPKEEPSEDYNVAEEHREPFAGAVSVRLKDGSHRYHAWGNLQPHDARRMGATTYGDNFDSIES